MGLDKSKRARFWDQLKFELILAPALLVGMVGFFELGWLIIHGRLAPWQ